MSEKTRIHYAETYDKHILPELGSLSLRDITPEVIARWQADRLATGAGPVAVRHALKLLGRLEAGVEEGRPYDLRHSFASILLHEGRSVIYVARQLGHDARLTLSTYGHVIDEFDEMPNIDAETAIAAARSAPPADTRTALGPA